MDTQSIHWNQFSKFWDNLAWSLIHAAVFLKNTNWGPVSSRLITAYLLQSLLENMVCALYRNRGVQHSNDLAIMMFLTALFLQFQLSYLAVKVEKWQASLFCWDRQMRVAAGQTHCLNVFDLRKNSVFEYTTIIIFWETYDLYLMTYN